MSDAIHEILNALFWSVSLSFVAWVTLQFGTCIALSIRRGGRVSVAAACGLIPVPFVGIGIVLAITSGRIGAGARQARRAWNDVEPPRLLEFESDDWSEL